MDNFVELHRCGFAVLTPNSAQAIADLADSRIGLNAFENSRQQIFRAARALLKLGQRRLHSVGVSPLRTARRRSTCACSTAGSTRRRDTEVSSSI